MSYLGSMYLAVPHDWETAERELLVLSALRRQMSGNHEVGQLVASEDQAMAFLSEHLTGVGVVTDQERRAFAVGTLFAIATVTWPGNAGFPAILAGVTIGDVARQVAGIPLPSDRPDADGPPPVDPGGPAVAGHGDIKPGPVADAISDDEDPPGPGPGEDLPPRT